jgi:hypothetical protein
VEWDIVSVFGFLPFGGVLCLHFPRLLSSPELRLHYPNAHHARINPMPHSGGNFIRNRFFDSAQEKDFGLTGMLLANAAAALGE